MRICYEPMDGRDLEEETGLWREFS
jgi:hypothetical protein